MKQKVISYWLLFIVPIMIFLSCTENEFQLNDEELVSSFEKNEANIALENLALLIQDANHSNQFRTELRNEAIKEYARDFYVQKAKLKSGNIESQIKKFLKNSSFDFDLDQLQKIVDQIPNYEISVPVHCEAWDAENYNPLVAYVPIDFNQKIHRQIKAFDSEGKVIWLKADEDPDLPVILIRPIEDIDYSKYAKSNEDGLKSTRVDGASEFVSQIGTDNINAVEWWISGPQCEIKCITIKGTGTANEDYFYPTRTEINNTYHTVNHKLFNWYTDYYGNAITMHWVEEDGGNTLTINLGYTDTSGLAASLSYQIKDADDELGYKTVFFSDYVGTEYNTGKIKWKNNNSVYCPYIGSFDGANCYVGTAPTGTTAFIHNGNFYYTPLNGTCPYPGSSFDGANCYVTAIPPDAHPFVHNNKWYVQPYNF